LPRDVFLVLAAFFACFAFGAAGSLLAAALSRCFLVAIDPTLSAAAASTAALPCHRSPLAEPGVRARLLQAPADETDLVPKSTELLGAAPLIVLARLKLVPQSLELIREVAARGLRPSVARVAEPQRHRCRLGTRVCVTAIAFSGGRVHGCS
jgi:hypothetical protein